MADRARRAWQYHLAQVGDERAHTRGRDIVARFLSAAIAQRLAKGLDKPAERCLCARK